MSNKGILNKQDMLFLNYLAEHVIPYEASSCLDAHLRNYTVSHMECAVKDSLVSSPSAEGYLKDAINRGVINRDCLLIGGYRFTDAALLDYHAGFEGIPIIDGTSLNKLVNYMIIIADATPYEGGSSVDSAKKKYTQVKLEELCCEKGKNYDEMITFLTENDFLTEVHDNAWTCPVYSFTHTALALYHQAMAEKRHEFKVMA